MRSGMSAVVEELRQKTEAGNDDYEIAEKSYWSDNDLEAVLDGQRNYHAGISLVAKGVPVENDTQYYRYEFPPEFSQLAVEGTAEGTAYFNVLLSTGAAVAAGGTPDWTFSPSDKAITFDRDTEGTAYYWSGYSYNINEAAREVWTKKAAHAWTAINFAADGARFDREALHKHCLTMADLMVEVQGISMSTMERTDLQPTDDGRFF